MYQSFSVVYQCFSVDVLVVGAGDAKPCSFVAFYCCLYVMLHLGFFGVDVLVIGVRDAKPRE